MISAYHYFHQTHRSVDSFDSLTEKSLPSQSRTGGGLLLLPDGADIFINKEYWLKSASSIHYRPTRSSYLAWWIRQKIRIDRRPESRLIVHGKIDKKNPMRDGRPNAESSWLQIKIEIQLIFRFIAIVNCFPVFICCCALSVASRVCDATT